MPVLKTQKKIPMITLTPNPALDLSGHVPQILANEKNYVIKPRLDPGGNGINVARMIARLGDPVIAMGFLGGAPGQQLAGLLKNASIVSRFTSIQADTRTNVTVTNDSDHQQTRLTFPGPKIQKSEIQALFKKIDQLKGPGLFMLGGSLPTGCLPQFYIEIARKVARKNFGLLVDLPSHSLKTFMAGYSAPALFVKPNRHELEELLGHRLTTDAQILKAAQKLNKKFALVAISLGRRGALFSTLNQAWIAESPRVRARGSVGSGDSMVAGILRMLAHYQITQPQEMMALSEKSILEILSWGIAAGAATAEAEGTALGSAKRVEELITKVKIRKFKK